MREIDPYKEEPIVPVSKLRERVVEQLTLNYAHDNLTVEDFEYRIDLAHRSDQRDELKTLIRDLPVLREEGEQTPRESSSGVAWNNGKVRKDETMMAILGGVERKGPWNPARYTKILAFMGGVDLDLRDAKFPPGETEFDVVCVMGGIEIVVPEGVNVEMSGVPIMGGFDNKVGHSGSEDAPTIRIRGFCLMGGVEVRYPKRKRRKK